MALKVVFSQEFQNVIKLLQPVPNWNVFRKVTTLKPTLILLGKFWSVYPKSHLHYILVKCCVIKW